MTAAALLRFRVCHGAKHFRFASVFGNLQVLIVEGGSVDIVQANDIKDSWGLCVQEVRANNLPAVLFLRWAIVNEDPRHAQKPIYIYILTS